MRTNLLVRVGSVAIAMLALATLTHALSSATAASSTSQVVPGSPNRTTTIPGTQLPPPDPKFGGVIKEKATDSTVGVKYPRSVETQDLGRNVSN